MPLKTRRLLLLLSAIAFLILVPIVLLYTAGYRLTDDWGLKKTGGIYIHSPLSGSEIYLNNELEKTTNILQTGVFIQSLKPANYEVLVAKDGYWPWQKKLAVHSEFVAEANAFLMPRSPNGQTVLRGHFSALYGSPNDDVLMIEESIGGNKRPVFYLPNSDLFLTADSTSTARILARHGDIRNVRWENGVVYITNSAGKIIQAAIDLGNAVVNAKIIVKPPETLSLKAPVPEVPAMFTKYDSRERIRLYAQGNVIFAEWLHADLLLPYFMRNEKERIVAAREAIRGLEFYPNRRDILIYAEGMGIYVTELDDRGGRNTQPIYKGTAPTFALLPGDKNIYVLDGGVLMRIELP